MYIHRADAVYTEQNTQVRCCICTQTHDNDTGRETAVDGRPSRSQEGADNMKIVDYH